MGVTPGPDGAALLVLAGTLPEPPLLRSLRSSHATLVAADGAAIALEALGLRPDVVIGDLDSIGALRDDLGEAGVTVVEEASQELGDFEKALLWIAEVGYRRVTTVGIDGGMLDHTLNNFSVLARHARRLSIEIRSGASIGWCVVDRLEIATVEGERVSLIPLPSARLTTSGLAWQLTDERLSIGAREGGSNRATGDRVAVEVHEGTILLIHWPSPGLPFE
jgi:thiamine pyrophosphokinase